MKHIKKALCSAFIFVFLFTILSTTVTASTPDYEYFIDDSGVVLTKYIGEDKVVVIPSKIEGRKIIKVERTFYNNTTIEKVVLPEGLTVVGEQTFFGCTNLKNVILPDSVQTIDNYAFAYCGLSEIILPINAHYINEGAFMGCNNLTAIESHALPFSEDNIALFIGQRAFENSKIRAIKTSFTPSYYDNSFTGVCHFTDSTINYVIYRSDFLNTIIEPIRKLTPLQAALFLTALVLFLVIVVLLCMYAVRVILKLCGKNKLSNYKEYSKRVINDIPSKKQEEQIVNYKPIYFLQDKLRSTFSKCAITIVGFAYLIFLFYVSTANNWEMNAFLNAAICILGGILVSVIVIALIAWTSYKIRSIISEHKEADTAKVRIRRIGGGNKND